MESSAGRHGLGNRILSLARVRHLLYRVTCGRLDSLVVLEKKSRLHDVQGYMWLQRGVLVVVRFHAMGGRKEGHGDKSQCYTTSTCCARGIGSSPRLQNSSRYPSLQRLSRRQAVPSIRRAVARFFFLIQYSYIPRQRRGKSTCCIMAFRPDAQRCSIVARNA